MEGLFKSGDLNATFYIREGTRNEYLTASQQDGRVVRWSELDTSNRAYQQWYISAYSPASHGENLRFRLQNVATSGFLHIGFQGGFGWYWATPGELPAKESTFAFERTGMPAPAGAGAGPIAEMLNIREFSANEFVGIGSNGWAIRWAKSGAADQRFYLETAASLGILPAPQAIQYAAEQIPYPPELASVDDSPHATQLHLVSEEIVPAGWIRDPSGADPLAQARSSPWYVLRHYQSYGLPGGDLAAARVFTPLEDITLEVSVRTLFKEEDLHAIEDRFTWTISGEIAFRGEATQSGVTPEGGKTGGKIAGSGKLGFSVSRAQTMKDSTKRSYEEDRLIKTVVKYPKSSTPFAIAHFVLLDTYELLDSQGRMISQWSAWDDSRTVTRSFPRALVTA